MNKRRKEVKDTIKKAEILFNNIKKDPEKADFFEDDEKKIAHIEIKLIEGNIYDELSQDGDLKSEIYDFIEKAFKLANKKYDLELDITYPESMQEDEKNKIEKLLKAHYAINIVKTNESVKRHNIASIILLIVGAIVYGAYGLLTYFKVDFIFQGIIEIASWVFIWEAVDMFFLSNFETRIDRLKNIRIFNSIIKRG